jgi:hypothetical protein
MEVAILIGVVVVIFWLGLLIERRAADDDKAED